MAFSPDGKTLASGSSDGQGIIGWDISGVVEQVVPGVTRFQVGDEVYGGPGSPGGKTNGYTADLRGLGGYGMAPSADVRLAPPSETFTARPI